VNLLKEVYVANFGDDATGDGSKEKPFATLQHAVELAENNATVYVKQETKLNVEYQNKTINIKVW
jgi:hypothetical protein